MGGSTTGKHTRVNNFGRGKKPLSLEVLSLRGLVVEDLVLLACCQVACPSRGRVTLCAPRGLFIVATVSTRQRRTTKCSQHLVDGGPQVRKRPGRSV